MVGGYGNIWRTTPLIKPKERHVLSFHATAATASHCIALCASLMSARLYRLYLENERALARKFAPIPFHSRARHGLGVGCRNTEAKPTDVTRSSARIARGEDETRLSFVPFLTPILFPSCSPFSLDRNIRFPLSRPFRLESAALVSLRAIN